jgi:nucleoside 2-deoxyribosyltransferase
MKIYLASPFFNEKELKHVSEVENVLRSLGHTVFSPREHQLSDFEFGSVEWRTHVFRNDVDHIKWCDAIVAIIKDNYDDTGTAWELGFGYAIGKPIYVYNPTGKPLNLMVTDSLHAYFETIEEIKEYDFETSPIKPYLKEVI